MSPLLLSGLAFLTSLVTLALMLLRSRQNDARLTEPRCNRCGYDLRGAAVQTGAGPAARCPECGTDLSTPGAVRWGQYPRGSWQQRSGTAGVIVAGALLAVVWTAYCNRSPAVIPRMPVYVSVSTMSTRFTPSEYKPPPPPTSEALIATATANLDDWNTWSQLTQRLKTGALSRAETDALIDAIFAQQVHSSSNLWSGSNLQEFLRQADQAYPIDAARVARMARAIFHDPSVIVASRARQYATIPFRVEFERLSPNLVSAALHVQRVNALTAVRAGPTPLELASTLRLGNYEKGNRADLFSSQGEGPITGTIKADLPPGNYRLTFDIETTLLRDEAVPRMLHYLPGQPTNWPAGRARWSCPATVPLTVVDPSQSPILLVHDPALAEAVKQEIVVQSLVAVRSAFGCEIVANLRFNGDACPISFVMSVRAAGVEHPLGFHVAAPGINTGGRQDPGIANLPADVRTVDLIFRPAPDRAEEVPGMDHIWGDTVELLNQPLKRYDLPADSAAGP